MRLVGFASAMNGSFQLSVRLFLGLRRRWCGNGALVWRSRLVRRFRSSFLSWLAAGGVATVVGENSESGEAKGGCG